MENVKNNDDANKELAVSCCKILMVWLAAAIWLIAKG